MKQVTLLRLETVLGANVPLAIQNAKNKCGEMDLVVALEPDAAFGILQAMINQMEAMGLRLKDGVDVVDC